MRHRNGQIRIRAIRPFLAQTARVSADGGICGLPAYIEARGTHDNIKLVLYTIGGPDALRCEFLDAGRDDADVVFAQGLQVSSPGCWATTADGEVGGHDQIGQFGFLG